MATRKVVVDVEDIAVRPCPRCGCLRVSISRGDRFHSRCRDNNSRLSYLAQSASSVEDDAKHFGISPEHSE